MNDDLIILDGCTFVYSDGSGDVEAEEAEGFFYQDVRHLSRWLLRIDGEDFLEVINRAPSISGTLLRGISGRLARTHPSDQAKPESGGGPPIRGAGPE